jgi:hypothetical protein
MSFNFEFLLIVLVAAAGFLILRIFFSPAGSKSPMSFDQIHAENQRSTLPSTTIKTAWDKSRTAPVSDNLGRVRVTQFNFAHFDAIPGPPDPDSFADELILELYDSVSDFRWTATYVVATPAGIRKLMDEERWSFFYATEIFVVRRYDLQTIREAVYGRLKEVHDEVPLDPEEPPLRA